MGEIDDFERGQRRSRQIRFAILGLVLASPFLWLGWSCHKRNAQNDEWREEARRENALSDGQKAELTKLIPELRTRLQAASKAFAEDVTPAKLEAAVPGDGECPVRVAAVGADGDAYAGYGGGGGVQIVKAGAVPKPEGLTSDAQSLERLAEDIKTADEPTKQHLERARDLADGLGTEVFLVGERTEPLVLADSYVPGRVRGTAFVYSAEARRIVCAADVDVENAPEVNIEYTTSSYDVTGAGNKREAATAKLAQDLGARTRKAIRASLRAVR